LLDHVGIAIRSISLTILFIHLKALSEAFVFVIAVFIEMLGDQASQ